MFASSGEISYKRVGLCGMALRHSFLHQCLFQHLLRVAGTYSTLLAHAQAGFQIPHPVSAPIDGIANRGIGYTFADTNIHDKRLKSSIRLLFLLFSQNQLTVTGTPQPVLLAVMLNKNLISMQKQGITVNPLVLLQHAKASFININFRNCN